MPVDAQELINLRLRENAALQTLYARAQKIIPVDAGHDFYHILRVAKLMLVIYANEKSESAALEFSKLEQDQCVLAALLHDCVPVAKDSPLRKESARLCSEKAHEWMSELHFDPETIGLVSEAILTHSYSSGLQPLSLLGKVLQDADRLEALGALGLYRAIATGVAMGSALFDAADPWAQNRSLDDRKFTVDHFYAKLLKLPSTFHTQAAKKEANRRASFLESFVSELKHELELNDLNQ